MAVQPAHGAAAAADRAGLCATVHGAARTGHTACRATQRAAARSTDNATHSRCTGIGIETPRIVPPGAVAAPAPGQVTNAGANSFTYPTPQPPPPVTSGEAMRIPTPQPPPPPQVSGDAAAGAPTDGRGNYYDRAEGQWKPIPSVQTGTAPASGGAPGRGGIVSAALSAINPMGSAQAAEVTPEMKAAMPVVDSSGKLEPLAPAPNARPTTGAESTERMTEVTPDKAEPDKGIPTITVKPDPLTGQSKPATPATPEKASPKQPPQQQSSAPVPVKSGETGGKVVPDQKGDTQQSEPTNTSYAPPVNPHPYAWLKANDPEKAALVDEAVRLHGDGGTSVTADQLAAHWANESHFGYTSITSKDGAIGPLQILAATARQMDPHGQFDTTTVKGGLAVATLYLKHLAVDEHLGVNSVATNFAYMRGPVAAREAQADLQTAMQKYPVAFKGLQSFYPDMKLTSDQFPGSGNGSSYRDNWQQIAQQDTPDGVLHMIATTGPTGLGMTDRWMQVEGAMVAAAIAHGNYDAVQHVTDWVAQMSHAGALSNLALASSMMQSGNMEGAAGALAKAHAFFPDGTYAQFGTDAKGRLVGRQFSEKDGTPMGNAFLINNEQIMQQMLQLQNPRTYIQALQTYQKNNAEIEQTKAHAALYRAMPGLKEEAIQATRERDSARTDAQQARLDAQTQARRDKEQHDFDLQQQKQEGRVGNEDKVDTAVNTDYKERTTAARNAVTDAGDDAGKRAAAQAEVDRLGRESQISRELRCSKCTVVTAWPGQRLTHWPRVSPKASMTSDQLSLKTVKNTTACMTKARTYPNPSRTPCSRTIEAHAFRVLPVRCRLVVAGTQLRRHCRWLPRIPAVSNALTSALVCAIHAWLDGSTPTSQGSSQYHRRPKPCPSTNPATPTRATIIAR